MYERLTDRARKVFQLANAEAQRLNSKYVGTEHVLLGLAKEGSGVAVNVLKNLGVDHCKILAAVDAAVIAGPDSTPTMGKLPLTPGAKRAVEFALEEAKDLGHNYVGTEHLLLGLLRGEQVTAPKVLVSLGLKLEDVRREVLEMLGTKPEGNEDDPSFIVDGTYESLFRQVQRMELRIAAMEKEQDEYDDDEEEPELHEMCGHCGCRMSDGLLAACEAMALAMQDIEFWLQDEHKAAMALGLAAIREAKAKETP